MRLHRSKDVVDASKSWCNGISLQVLRKVADEVIDREGAVECSSERSVGATEGVGRNTYFLTIIVNIPLPENSGPFALFAYELCIRYVRSPLDSFLSSSDGSFTITSVVVTVGASRAATLTVIWDSASCEMLARKC